MEKKQWKAGDSAFVLIGKNDTFPNRVVVREVALVTKTRQNVWIVGFDDIADDADIKYERLCMPERFLYETMDDALSSAVDDFVTGLMNEHQEWLDETSKED